MRLFEQIEQVKIEIPVLRQGLPMAEPSPHELDKRIALLEQAVKNIDKELMSISANLNRLVWVVVGAVVVGVINLWVKGGVLNAAAQAVTG